MVQITEMLAQYKEFLIGEEKSGATIEKYIRDVRKFLRYCENAVSFNREDVLKYKRFLMESGYATRSINSMLASLNSFFAFTGHENLKVQSLKVQQQIFCGEERELSRKEYERLCDAAGKCGNEKLLLILETLCSSGIRVSELKYITVEAAGKGEATVFCKGKVRTVFLVRELRKKLLKYAAARQIESGPLFLSRGGREINRTTVWRWMKNLCRAAKVAPGKVFPHNLRHLFARLYYKVEKDIAKLADILGHSSINTTRIYIVSSGSEHRHQMERLGLVS